MDEFQRNFRSWVYQEFRFRPKHLPNKFFNLSTSPLWKNNRFRPHFKLLMPSLSFEKKKLNFQRKFPPRNTKDCLHKHPVIRFGLSRGERKKSLPHRKWLSHVSHALNLSKWGSLLLILRVTLDKLVEDFEIIVNSLKGSPHDLLKE